MGEKEPTGSHSPAGDQQGKTETSAAKAAGQRFGASAIGAAIAESVCMPLDVSKVRLQVQAPLPDGSFRYTGFLQCVRRIAAEEGTAALWRGIEPALVRQVSYTGLSFVLYTPVRNAIAGDVPADQIPFWKRVLAGGTAGGVSILAMNPTDVVKTQVQVKQGRTARSMSSVISTIYSTAGVTGFWRGWQPNVTRCFIVNACEIGVYDEAKMRIGRLGVADGPLTHFAASAAAGLLSACCSTPVDVVRTRLMAQAGGGRTELTAQYTGVFDCALRMLRDEGWTSLYKVTCRAPLTSVHARANRNPLAPLPRTPLLTCRVGCAASSQGFWPIATRKILWTISYFLAYEQALKYVRNSYSD